MAARTLLKVLGAPSPLECQSLPARTAPRLRNFWGSTSKSRSYSTQCTDPTLLEGDVTPENGFHNETREDQDRRQRNAEYQRRWYARKLANDPGFRAMLNQKAKGWQVKRRANDPEYLAEIRRRRAELHDNPDKHEAKKEYDRNYDKSRRDADPAYRMNSILRKWIIRREWLREGLNWTPWHPVLYPERVEHQCRECGAKRHGGAKLWWKSLEAQDITCHSCYLKLSDGGLPKGYEGCTTIKEIGSRKKALENHPFQALTARGLTGQSWKSPMTPSHTSRSFSTFRATWTTSNEREDLKEVPTQDSQCQSPNEADLLEAKRQYQLAKSAYKETRGADPQVRERSAAARYMAELRFKRARYAWRKVNDVEWVTEYLSRKRKKDQLYSQRPEVRMRWKERRRSGRVNDPMIRLRDMVYRWVNLYPVVRTMADWTSFKPVRYSKKIAHHCQGCGFVRSDGLKLWWQQSSGADVYQCHACFIRGENGGLPEAYKDCTTPKELTTRFEQLNGVRPKVELETFDICSREE